MILLITPMAPGPCASYEAAVAHSASVRDAATPWCRPRFHLSLCCVLDSTSETQEGDCRAGEEEGTPPFLSASYPFEDHPSDTNTAAQEVPSPSGHRTHQQLSNTCRTSFVTSQPQRHQHQPKYGAQALRRLLQAQRRQLREAHLQASPFVQFGALPSVLPAPKMVAAACNCFLLASLPSPVYFSVLCHPS